LPVTEIPLDSSTREEEVTLLHGRNLLIKLVENREITNLLADGAVRDFLSTEDLCYKDFRNAMNTILRLERELDEELKKELLYRREQAFRQARYYRKGFSPRRPLTYWSMLYSGIPREKIEALLPEKLLTDLRTRTELSVGRLQRIDSELLAFEKELKRFNSSLEVLHPTVILRCPRCGLPVFTERKPTGSPIYPDDAEFSEVDVVKGEIKGSTTCLLCHLVFERGTALRINLHLPRVKIREIWNRNIWLEDYVSRLLQSMQWKTWSHAYVLGSSGVRHEIDVLGVKGSYVLVCECKTGDVARQDVFNFWAKAYDIRSHVNMLALVELLPEPETREFVTKNPSLFLLENLGEKKRSEIVDELKSSIVGRI